MSEELYHLDYAGLQTIENISSCEINIIDILNK